MPLTATDWLVIVGYLLVNLLIGIYYRRRASGNTEEFFISGRDVSWWLAGTSMVATTFAADTPLLVTGLVARQGIAGNWIWWGSCVGGMLTVFFFARYWRRSEILTDVELVEIRYGGKPAAFLRGFKAIYLGLFMNCFILGWVTQAMVNIITVLLGPAPDQRGGETRLKRCELAGVDTAAPPPQMIADRTSISGVPSAINAVPAASMAREIWPMRKAP